MKGLFTILTLFIIMFSCKESGVPISKPSTFVRYFNDGNRNFAVDVLETSVKGDKGFLILSYSQPSGNIGRINLTKTSANGNTLWEKYIESKTLSDLKPSNIVAIKDNLEDTGYLIVGTSQNPSYGSRLFVARTDINGDLLSSADSSSYYTKSGDGSKFRLNQGVYLKGRGIAQTTNATNDFFVIAQVFDYSLLTSPDTSIFLAQINGFNLKTVFTEKFLGNTSDLSSRLYLNYDLNPATNQTKLFWGGTRVDSKGTHLNFTRSGYGPLPQNVDWAQTYPNYNPDSYQEHDLCPYGSGYYGIIGARPDSVIFIQADPSDAGKQLRKMAYPLANSTSQKGASICTKMSCSFMLLYTKDVDAGGTNTDYVLAKVDIEGNPTKDWPAPKKFGGKYLDTGKRVLQSSDGGYIVLGTTVLANVETVFFMKTDGGGNIQ